MDYRGFIKKVVIITEFIKGKAGDKMKNLTLENIARAVDGELFLAPDKEDNDKNIEAVSVVIDSRKVEENGVFIATRGERVDGHSFIDQCWEKGILCAIGEEPLSNSDYFKTGIKGNYIQVKDSFIAIKALAEYYLNQLDIKKVGITGSVGKTSTKEMVASVLSKHFVTQKTIGNFNNEVGVPLTVFSIRDEHEAAVIEMGISDFNEMTRLSKIVKPDVCVLTNVGPCHLEYLGDLEGVLKAKTEIFTYMNKEGSVCVNGDDEYLSTVNEVYGRKTIKFGHISENNEVYATDIKSMGVSGTRCVIHTKKGEFNVIIPLPGVHMVDNALAATAVGLIFDMPLEEIKDGIETVEGLSGRSNLIRTKEYLIVDDCYNANPKAMKSALDLLSNANGRKVAILGDMFELGEDSDKMHSQVGEYAIGSGCELLICCGENSKHMYKSAVDTYIKKYTNKRKHNENEVKKSAALYIKYYVTREQLIEALKKGELLERDDNILIKASHGMGFDKVVEFLKENE